MGSTTGVGNATDAEAAEPSHDEVMVATTGSDHLGALAWRGLLAIALTKAALQLATATMYGFRGNELYLMAMGHRLQWHYIENGPFVPALYRFSETFFGSTELGVKIVPILIGVGLVFLGGALARELGGSRWAQLVTGTAAAVGPVYVGATRFLAPITLEIVVGSVLALLLVRLVRTGDQRWWISLGVVAGLGIYNRATLLLWVIGLMIGMLSVSSRRLVFGRYAAAGALAAVVILSPRILWMARDDWYLVRFAGGKVSERPALIEFVVAALFMASPGAPLLWLRTLVPSRSNEPTQLLGIAWFSTFVLSFVANGKPYYAAMSLLPVVAAGAVLFERSRGLGARRVVTGLVVVTGLLMAPMITPVLPARLAVSSGVAHPLTLDEMMGFRALARQVAAAYHSLPADDRTALTLITWRHGEAGALEHWHTELGLPLPISADTSYWQWGPGNARSDAPVLVVAYPVDELERFFVGCTKVAELGQGEVMDRTEDGQPIHRCDGPRRPWKEMWPDMRHTEQ